MTEARPLASCPYSPEECVEGANDDELADFLCKVQGEVVEEAGRLLARRTVE